MFLSGIKINVKKYMKNILDSLEIFDIYIIIIYIKLLLKYVNIY
jgi:hypothetical protein